jgi:hydroxyacylglutathione hydrolase
METESIFRERSVRMTLEIVSFKLGPMQNNSYLLVDLDDRTAVCIDPSFGSHVILDRMRQENWTLAQIWITHAHFDHYIGVTPLVEAFQPHIKVGLHKDDLDLWEKGGEAAGLGVSIDVKVKPSLFFTHHQILRVGNHNVEARHTPGHTPGHVAFYVPDLATLFCGDVIFYQSIGRTDMSYSSTEAIMRSIQTQILTLPQETKLLSGHGQETSVKHEKFYNPFLQDLL